MRCSCITAVKQNTRLPYRRRYCWSYPYLSKSSPSVACPHFVSTSGLLTVGWATRLFINLKVKDPLGFVRAVCQRDSYDMLRYEARWWPWSIKFLPLSTINVLSNVSDGCDRLNPALRNTEQF